MQEDGVAGGSFVTAFLLHVLSHLLHVSLLSIIMQPEGIRREKTQNSLICSKGKGFICCCPERNWKEGWSLHSFLQCSYSKDNCSLAAFHFQSEWERGYNVPFHTISMLTANSFQSFLEALHKRGTKAALMLTKQLFPVSHWRNSLDSQALQPGSTSLTLFSWLLLSNDSCCTIGSVFHNFGFAVPPSLLMFMETAVSFCLLPSLVCSFAVHNFYHEHFTAITNVPIQMTTMHLIFFSTDDVVIQDVALDIPTNVVEGSARASFSVVGKYIINKI